MINYGIFLNALIAFLLTVWIIFFVVKFINRLRPGAFCLTDATPFIALSLLL
ncbi:hypothetical protein [Marinobacter sp.]|uniref:hypothetical protein n=1 Tax=Marinobacter sp. TaxID=50741 RepID=UPI00384A5ABC